MVRIWWREVKELGYFDGGCGQDRASSNNSSDEGGRDGDLRSNKGLSGFMKEAKVGSKCIPVPVLDM